MPRILVTGATGKLGSTVIDHLLTLVPASDIVGIARNPEKAARLHALGVETRSADYEDVDSLVAALDGIDRVLFISSGGADMLVLYNESAEAGEAGRIRQHTNMIAAARRSNVSFIAYTSAPKADQRQMAISDVHADTEQMIQESGIDYAILRNNWYLENAVEEIAVVEHVIDGGTVVTATRDGRIGWVIREELGEAAAEVLAAPERHTNVVYELSGEQVDYEQFAAALGEAIGREVIVEHVADEEYFERVGPLVREPLTTIEAETAFQDEVRRGLLDVPEGDLERALGRKPTSLVDSLRTLIGRLESA